MISPLILTTWEGIMAFPWDEIIVSCPAYKDGIIIDFDFVYKEKTYYCYFYRTDVTPHKVLDWLACPSGYEVTCKITDTSYNMFPPYSQVIRYKTFQEVKSFLERLTIIDRL